MSAWMAVLTVVVALTAFALTVIAGGTFWWSLYAWRSPDQLSATRFADDPDETALTFSLIVPCRDEPEAVVRATVAALLAQRHPDFEVVLSVGHDDLPMLAIADRIAAEDPRVGVSVDHHEVKNKPRQLNTALALCSGDVVGILDAESLTAPDLLRRVDATFTAREADVVQGAVQLMNYRSRWFTLRNCLEYRIWFRSRLHGHAEAGFIPLGGNTVFLRRTLLEQVGGWDGDCLAEDCEIGVRLSAQGKRIVVAYDADLTTREEAPTTLRALVRQRTRWSLGFMQVLAKGEWRALPTTRQRVGAWWTLVQQHAMAFSGLVLPLAVATALFADLPVLVGMVAFLPLVPTVALVAFEVLILHDLGKDLGWRLGVRDYVTLVVSTPFYQLLLALAALRALVKYVGGDFRWEKTAHSGAHLTPIGEPA
ncbi:glycosyltransferase family 2 protein [Nocardioides sp.]|uniref:glycosyltransferase family 2 protein n=1 Tax=Nocardioides sp. TaxID=35761 RepID=UPI001A353591|nr:glycosyltransferase family 2 protein [Nocardioides sp.]MBJ7357226.1 glycosyltransferase family 2 protein [Nocardioides sp.]